MRATLLLKLDLKPSYEMLNPGVFLTVVYPQSLPYLRDVRNSAMNQTCKDFDFIIINDGCETSKIKKELSGLNTIILEAEGGFSRNRLQGIDYARSRGYKYILFCDADDSFTPDRYLHTVKAFEYSQADIIVSNLNIVDERLKLIIKDYFSKEIPTERWIDTEFIKTKNIFGMSNTAIRLSSIQNGLKIPETNIVDWYLFTVLLQQGLKAKYVTESMVNYRQHSTNMIGINKFNVEGFRRLARLKSEHYRLLLENGLMQYETQHQATTSLQHLTDAEIENAIKRGLAAHPQPLWWQIISDLQDS